MSIWKYNKIVLPILSIILSMLLLELCCSAEINYKIENEKPISYIMTAEIDYDTCPSCIKSPISNIPTVDNSLNNTLPKQQAKKIVSTNKTITNNNSRSNLNRIFRRTRW